MTPADDTFTLAMRYLTDSIMQRRSAGHFSGEHQRVLEARADELSQTAFDLAVLGIGVPARR